jgi:hypothetical protein
MSYLPLKKFLLVVGQPLPRDETHEEQIAIVKLTTISKQVIFFMSRV